MFVSRTLSEIFNVKQVRQQDAYLAIRPAYPRGCCPRAAKRIKKLHTLLVSLYFSGRWDIWDVKARNGQKFEFLAHHVETPWPKWMALYQNVRRSLPYIFDCTSRRWEETGTIAGWSTIGEMEKTGFGSLIFGPPCNAGLWLRHSRQMPRAYDVEGAYERWLQNMLNRR